MTGEALTSNAAESSGIQWLSYVFLFAGILTAAAVFRVGFHTFFGWGTTPISDDASRVDELPEDREDDDKTFWFQFLPPAFCIAAAILLALLPHSTHNILEAANRLTFQPAYLHTVYSGATPTIAVPAGLNVGLRPSAMRGVLAAALAILLALTSIFRERLARSLRVGAALEGPLIVLRTLQSGLVGDYVLWLTIGAALLGTAYVYLLR